MFGSGSNSKCYRERRDADPDRRAVYLQKEKDKWQAGRQTGKKKGIADPSEREKLQQRKKWGERKMDAKAIENPERKPEPL